jgi:hypothetical protein
LWQELFGQLIHVRPDQPCPNLTAIRKMFERYLAQPSVRAELKASIGRHRNTMESRPPTRAVANRKVQLEPLRKALAAVASDLGAGSPPEEAQARVVPIELVQELLVEIFGVCHEPELVQALNKAVNSGRLANAHGGFVPAPLY